MKAKEIDLLIVVGMFLTGFDAPTPIRCLLTRTCAFHGLMQAYSRTNRIFDATKTFGNIVTFRDLEQATIDAITLFGDKNTKNVVRRRATRSTWKASPMRLPVRRVEVSWMWCRS